MKELQNITTEELQEDLQKLESVYNILIYNVEVDTSIILDELDELLNEITNELENRGIDTN